MRRITDRAVGILLLLVALAPTLAGCYDVNAPVKGNSQIDSTARPTTTTMATTTIVEEVNSASIPTLTPTKIPTASTVATRTLTPEETREAALAARLAEVSRDFIALTPEESDQIAQKVGFIDGINESASNSCGPVSIAILKAAGLLPVTTTVHDIWLLNMRKDFSLTKILYQKYFPPQEYDYIWVEQSIREYDFSANPLQPGDWLFLFTAGNGFDHMLTVTRVDENGAAYSVTNIDRGDDFIIAEEMLYNPNQEGVGLFYEITDLEKRMLLGLTGTKRWLLVRRKGGLATTPALNSELTLGFEQDVNWQVLVQDVNTGEVLFDSYPNEPFDPARLINVPIVVAALQIFEDMGYKVSDLADNGFGGQSFGQLFTAMIADEDELAVEVIRQFICKNTTESTALENLGLSNTVFLPRRTTAFDLASVLQGIHSREYLSEPFSRYLLDLIRNQTEYDAQYLSVIQETYPQVDLTSKRAASPDPTVESDMVLLTIDEETYTIIISGSLKKGGSAVFEDIRPAIEDFALQLMPFLLEKDRH
ncbi:class A beta-lactamase-related serine hydrolase [bacterium]|nr:class A beta-lactamase-related serine hydrolase [bacterium]